VKRTLIHDIEIFENYLLIGFQDIDTGEIWSWESDGPALSKPDAAAIRKFVMKHLIVGFNSRGFDMLILFAALQGFTVKALKKLTNEIILGRPTPNGFEQRKPWDIEREWQIKIPDSLDHIDLIEVAPGKASLKIYNGRMHGRRMQDLPIQPEAVLTREEKEGVYTYWQNDLAATKLLYQKLGEQIALRTALSKEYKMDLRSKSDAQVAEAVIKKQVADITGTVPKKPELSSIKPFFYCAPEYIRFENPTLRQVVSNIEAWEFKLDKRTGKVQMPDFLSSADITFEAIGERLGNLTEEEDEEGDGKLTVGQTVYRMGIGGLHSTEKRAVHVADEENDYIDADVASYYPRIILNLGLYPESMGKVFLKVYRGIVDRRLVAKAKQGEIGAEIAALKAQIAQANRPSELMAERLVELERDFHREMVANEGGKIMINGSFGKLGSRWSALFSPNLLITVTLTGQLSLLMLIEWLEKAGISVVSGNTDGILIKCPKIKRDRMKEIIDRWQEETGFVMETGEYDAVYMRDVNSYIALKKGKKPKRKGAYAKSGLEEKKNPNMDICAEAVVEMLDKGTPVSQTIRACRDITKFVTVRMVKGGAIYGVTEVEFERKSDKTGKVLKPGVRFDDTDASYLGKAVRFYKSTESDGALHYKGSLNRVPKSDGCKPLMDLPDSFPDDVDFASYIKDARQMLIDIGYHEEL
jgi:DNA polymerase elongation subunit (family B)